MQDTTELSAEALVKYLPTPSDMTFDAFDAEYSTLLPVIAAKERLGGLDPDDPSTYRPMSDAEHELMANDWKAFSRSRGFSEEDITEYERWLDISGQATELRGAINDPWRRRENYPGGWSRKLYMDHIEHRLARGEKLLPEVRASYEEQKDRIDAGQIAAGGMAVSQVVTPRPPTAAEIKNIDVW